MLPAMSAAGRTCVLPVRAAKGIRVAQVGNGMDVTRFSDLTRRRLSNLVSLDSGAMIKLHFSINPVCFDNGSALQHLSIVSRSHVAN